MPIRCLYSIIHTVFNTFNISLCRRNSRSVQPYESESKQASSDDLSVNWIPCSGHVDAQCDDGMVKPDKQHLLQKYHLLQQQQHQQQQQQLQNRQQQQYMLQQQQLQQQQQQLQQQQLQQQQQQLQQHNALDWTWLQGDNMAGRFCPPEGVAPFSDW